jgi:hypothetical protein
MAQVVAAVLLSNFILGSTGVGVGYGIGRLFENTDNSDDGVLRDILGTTNHLESIISSNEELKDDYDKMLK